MAAQECTPSPRDGEWHHFSEWGSPRYDRERGPILVHRVKHHPFVRSWPIFEGLIAQMNTMAPRGVVFIPQDAPDPNAERLKDWHEGIKAAARRGLIEIGWLTPRSGCIEVIPPADLQGATFDPSGLLTIWVTDGRPIVRPAKWRWRLRRSPMSVPAARREILVIWAAEEAAGRERSGRDQLITLLNATGKSISRDRVQEALATMPLNYRRGRGRPKRAKEG